MSDIDLQSVVRSFRDRTAEAVSLEQAGVQRFHVRTPFVFDDGDELGLVLKRQDGQWLLSDEGHTYMHLSYRIDIRDLEQGTRAKIISNALASLGVQDRDGELTLPIEGEQYGDALFTLAQAVLKISDVSFLSRERVKSTFFEDFRAIMAAAARQPVFDWSAREDPEKHYPVDCYIATSSRPMFVYALSGDDKVRDATISILHFEQQKLSFRSVGIHADQEQINRKVLARFSDVADKQFSRLAGSRDRIIDYVQQVQAEVS